MRLQALLRYCIRQEVPATIASSRALRFLESLLPGLRCLLVVLLSGHLDSSLSLASHEVHYCVIFVRDIEKISPLH
jgi:hypothetical protein